MVIVPSVMTKGHEKSYKDGLQTSMVTKTHEKSYEDGHQTVDGDQKP
jgi:hypothetical protein